MVAHSCIDLVDELVHVDVHPTVGVHGCSNETGLGIHAGDVSCLSAQDHSRLIVMMVDRHGHRQCMPDDGGGDRGVDLDDGKPGVNSDTYCRAGLLVPRRDRPRGAECSSSVVFVGQWKAEVGQCGVADARGHVSTGARDRLGHRRSQTVQ
jgi:hypothetical protein